MPVDIQSPSLCIGIVGTGAMGRGIAQIAAQAGIRVLLFDALHGAAANARDTVTGTLARLADKGKISAEALAAASSKLEVVTRLDELASAQVIIEAIVENPTSRSPCSSSWRTSSPPTASSPPTPRRSR
jgi:3-hydroxybutyryl-CoA dehydrogenase